MDTAHAKENLHNPNSVINYLHNLMIYRSTYERILTENCRTIIYISWTSYNFVELRQTPCRCQIYQKQFAHQSCHLKAHMITYTRRNCTNVSYVRNHLHMEGI